AECGAQITGRWCLGGEPFGVDGDASVVAARVALDVEVGAQHGGDGPVGEETHTVAVAERLAGRLPADAGTATGNGDGALVGRDGPDRRPAGRPSGGHCRRIKHAPPLLTLMTWAVAHLHGRADRAQ